MDLEEWIQQRGEFNDIKQLHQYSADCRATEDREHVLLQKRRQAWIVGYYRKIAEKNRIEGNNREFATECRLTCNSAEFYMYLFSQVQMIVNIGNGNVSGSILSLINSIVFNNFYSWDCNKQNVNFILEQNCFSVDNNIQNVI